MTHALLILGQAKPAGPDFLSMAPMFVAFIAIFYFIVLRPQQKQMKDQQLLHASLKKGDDVVTQAGLFGKIFTVAERDVLLEIAPGVKVKVLKSAIQGKVGAAEAAAPDAQPKKEEK